MANERAVRSAPLEQYLKRVRELQEDMAIEFLMRPSSKDAFGYGYACGTLQGLARAEQLLEEVLNEGEDEHE